MSTADPVVLEVYRHLFASVADEMGAVLRRTACSPNITERRDYSCAVFDGAGCMVAQGENIPVHLGSMPASVEAAVQEVDPGRGDVVILNDPYRGGTHLPDITMVAPLVPADTRRPRFYVAARAHHADVGGTAPGSMPLAERLEDEGVIIAPVLWVRGGEPETRTQERILAAVRTPDERRDDLAAQQAALDTGLSRLEEMMTRRGDAEVLAYASHLLQRAERTMRAAIAGIPDGTYHFEDALDGDGVEPGSIPIRVAVTITGDAAVIDFSGTEASVARAGMNAVPAITRSAAYYAFRCLITEAVPNNAGLHAPLDVRLPEGGLLNPPAGAAVAAGNVETSQRLVDVILGALAQALPGCIAAASQGTMNNLAFGGTDPRTGRGYTYYETIAGGHGGRPAGPGLAARHSHMTNSLNTPVEAMEHDLPVRVEEYAVRRGSGGAGRNPGGDGVIRRLRFLADAEVTLISERRSTAPYGLAGGEPGQAGKADLISPDGKSEALPAKFTRHLQAGDVIVIETPGGGGWGKK